MTTRPPSAGFRPADGPGAPPWLLVWALIYLWALPARWERLQFDWDGVRGAGDYESLTGIDGYWLVRAISAATVTVSLVVFAGFVAFACARPRGRWVERRYRLIERPASTGALEEIALLVSRSGTGVALRTNLVRTDLSAMTYPRRFRQPALAIFGGFVRLWRADRVAAEAVLAHELGHVRSGDYVVAGIGSPFVNAVRVALPVFVGLNLLPIAVRGDRGLTAGTASQAVLNGVFVLLLPIGALWLLELNADRAAVVAGRREGLRRALQSDRRPSRWWVQLQRAVSHPPAALRRAMATRWGAPKAEIAFLVAFPLLYLAQLLPLVGLSMRSATAAGYSAADAWALVSDLSASWLGRVAPRIALMAALLAAWPYVAPRLAALCGATTLVRREGCRLADPFAAAAMTFALALLCWLVGR